MNIDDRPSMRQETESFRALQIQMQADENHRKLTKRVDELKTALENIWNDPTTSSNALRAKAYLAWTERN